MALYQVCCEQSASQVAFSTKRATHTLWKWIKAYNEFGPKALQYKRTGGRPPFV